MSPLRTKKKLTPTYPSVSSGMSNVLLTMLQCEANTMRANTNRREVSGRIMYLKL